MNKISYAILIILIIAFILIGTLIIYMTNKENTELGNNQTAENIVDAEETNNISAIEVTNKSMYFSVESCINKYVEAISSKNSQAIFGMLDKKYKEKNKIDINNVLDFVIKEQNLKELNFDTEKMLVEGDKQDIQKYYVQGNIKNKEGYREENYFTVTVDIKAMVFSIFPEVPKGVFDEKK